MKFLVAVAFIAFAAVAIAGEPPKLTDEQRAKVRALSSECMTQEKLAPEAFEPLRKGEFSSIDQHGKCFLNCFLGKVGAFSDGTLKEDVVKAKLGSIVGEEKLNTVMAKCNSLKGADNCETAFKLYECYYNNHAAFM